MAAAEGRTARAAFGDYQTDKSLAVAVTSLVMKLGVVPTTVVEPTCGRGSFLLAAARAVPTALLLGLEVNPRHVADCRDALRSSGRRVSVRQEDFFSFDWDALARQLSEPILLLGNPPWVTSTGLSTLKVSNLPAKANIKGLTGIDSITGKSNFDISEWMLLRLIQAFSGRHVVGAFLVKTAVARRIVEFASNRELPVFGPRIYQIDATAAFGAAVEACLFVWRSEPSSLSRDCEVYADLEADVPMTTIGVRGGGLVADVSAFEETQHLLGRTDPAWRSGIKHDCSPVMVLTESDGVLKNGLGETVLVDDDTLFPLLRSSDIANKRIPSRWLIVTQTAVGQATAPLRDFAPATWAYLERHGDRLDARRSSIYRRAPRFALFGVGPYSFASWKVAVSGLYKRTTFTVVGPHRGKPVVFDDTCYLVPFEDEGTARAVGHLLNSDVAQRLLHARVFWGAKRPLTKDVLMNLDFGRLARDALQHGNVPSRLVAPVRELAGTATVEQGQLVFC